MCNGEAKERSQRLAILGDYDGVERREDLRDADVHDAKQRRERYFSDPDRGWHPHFEKLDGLLGRIDQEWTYVLGRVVHVDLVACATRARWGELGGGCKKEMLGNCRERFLANLSSVPDGTLVLLDGSAVSREIMGPGLEVEQSGGEQLINMRGDRGWVGRMAVGGKAFAVRGWSTPAGKLSALWRHDLAFWLRGTLRPRTKGS